MQREKFDVWPKSKIHQACQIDFYLSLIFFFMCVVMLWNVFTTRCYYVFFTDLMFNKYMYVFVCKHTHTRMWRKREGEILSLLKMFGTRWVSYFEDFYLVWFCSIFIYISCLVGWGRVPSISFILICIS